MEKQEDIEWKTVLAALEDLSNMVEYYCIGIYRVRDSFVNESLDRARKVIHQAKNNLLEVSRDN